MPTYTSNFLEKVILKLDFEDISFLKMPEYIAAVDEVFDINTTKNGFAGAINIDVIQGVVSQSKQDLNVKEFTSTTMPNKKITLSQKWLSLEYDARSYTNSTELLSDVERFVQPFIETLEVKLINRIGLRYVNQIVSPSNEDPLNWTEYINPQLISSLSFALTRECPVSRNFTQQYFKFPAADVLFSSGIWNDDFPNPIAAKSFILDFDCSSTVPREASDITLRTEIKSYNEIVEKLFEASIKEPLRNLMGVQR